MARIFTTEPAAVRALAAEIRHDPDAAARVLALVLEMPVDQVSIVGLEHTDDAIDLVLGSSVGAIGIEAKIAHVLTADQLAREALQVAHLVVLVDDPADIPPHLLNLYPVLTWAQLLAAFDQPRLTAADISVVDDKKRQKRRALHRVPEPVLRAGFTYAVSSTGGGRPSVDIYSPKIGARWLVAQVEASRDFSTWVMSMGISINSDDLRTAEVDEEPGWVRALNLAVPIAQKHSELLPRGLSFAKANRAEGKPHITAKLALADEFGLPRWAVKGYGGSYLGFKSRPAGDDEVEALVEATLRFVVEVHDELAADPHLFD